jgi:hypothetical protein
MSSLEVDSQQLLRADRAVKAEKGICLKVSQKTAIGITVGGIIVSFLIGLAIGFGCVASSHGVTSTPRPGLASGVRVRTGIVWALKPYGCSACTRPTYAPRHSAHARIPHSVNCSTLLHTVR